MGIKKSSATHISVRNYMDECQADPIRGNGIVSVLPREEIHVPEPHLFPSYDDNKQAELDASVKMYGVLNELTVRPRKEGGYELVDGYHRLKACKRACINMIPVIIKDMTKDQADIMRIDTNIHRNDIPISEKAKACKLKYDIRKRQGARGDSLEQMAAETGIHRKRLQRLMKLAELDEEYLTYVDDKVLPMSQAEDIAYLNKTEQGWVKKAFEEHGKRLTRKQSRELKSKKGTLTQEDVMRIFEAEIPVTQYREVTITRTALKEFFDASCSDEQVKEIIFSLLKEWKSGNDNLKIDN